MIGARKLAPFFVSLKKEIIKDKGLQKIAFNGALIETAIELIKYAIIIGIALELVSILYHLQTNSES